jgi:nucleoid DNA-binding protein
MSDFADRLPERIRAHLRTLLSQGASVLPDTEESLQALARIWVEKRSLFESQTRSLAMEQCTEFSAEDPRGALLLTYSGSLISLGSLPAAGSPPGEGSEVPPGPRADLRRRMEYASIGVRSDVPNLLVVEQTSLAEAVTVEREAHFRFGPLQASSPVLTIAACSPEVGREEQDRRIREATIFLTNGFLRLNRTVMPADAVGLEQFNLKNIVAYLAGKNQVTRKLARQLLQDYLAVIESGILLGEKVPLGRLGRLFLVQRPPRKARLGTNPATGERLTIPARPAEAAPRMRFSAALREKARGTDLNSRK